MRIPLVGQTYESRSVAVDAQRTINLYPERTESGQGKANLVLYPTPGLKPFASTTDKPHRGMFAELGRAFTVAGATLYEIKSDGTTVALGTVANDGGRVTMRTNGQQGHQLFVTSGGYGYIYDLNSGVFTPLTTVAGFPSGKAVSGTFLDGYFVVNTSNEFQVSALFDGLSWNATDKAARSAGADPIVVALQSHRELWVWGEVTTEVWVNVGATFPFAPIGGVFIEMGCGAPYSAIRYDNQVAWLAANRDGDRIAVVATQYTPQRVSTHAVEMAWRRYDKTNDAVGFAYQDDGHTFWVLTFPTAGATWVFDAATKMWHERAYWNTTIGQWEAHRAICHCRAFEKHLVGDRLTGDIYDWNLRHALDGNVDAIRRLRRTPHLSQENVRMVFSRLEVELEAGLPTMPYAVQTRDPMVMLRWSDDRGHTWSSEQWVSAGRTGEYKARAYWNRLGSSRDRVFEVTMTADIPWRLIDGYLTAEKGRS
jgi:hypothetical protein